MTRLLSAVAILSVFLIGNGCGKNLFTYHKDSPCSYYDSVNLTGIGPLANGSYVYDGVVIPSRWVKYFDYKVVNRSSRVDVPKHLRGCICKLKPCINLCCPQGHTKRTVNGTVRCVTVEQEINSTVLVSDGNEQKAVDMNKFFVAQTYAPCEKMFMMVPQIYEYDKWTLFRNGTLRLEDTNKYLHREQYCFNPYKLSPNDSSYIMNPMNCLDPDDPKEKDIIDSYSMLFSIPFMVFTIIVYMGLPELRNLHGKLLSCYLGCLVIAYPMLIRIKSTQKPEVVSCALLGYSAYFFFMSSYLWLSAISFDLWWNFRGTHIANRNNEGRRLLVYSCYTWGLAATFTLLVYIAQSSGLPQDWQPGFPDYCFINARTGWVGLLYFYGPLLLILILNTTFFILTSVKIYTVQRGLARMIRRNESQKNLRKEKDNVWLFLRLFIVMGVSWLMEVLSYMAGPDTAYKYLFNVTDICNAILGFIIFVLFVMKRKVKDLVVKRFSAGGNLPVNDIGSSKPTGSTTMSQNRSSRLLSRENSQIVEENPL